MPCDVVKETLVIHSRDVLIAVHDNMCQQILGFSKRTFVLCHLGMFMKRF